MKRICECCGKTYEKEIGKSGVKYCSHECYLLGKKKLSEERYSKLPKCSVDGCERKANRINQGLCETHYYRIRRTGTTEPRKLKGYSISSAGYIRLLEKHKLTDNQGYVLEHRKVAYEHYGDKEHQCYWCGIKIDWSNLVVDHLNEIKNDNRVENLVLTCNECNRTRGAMLSFVTRVNLDKFEYSLDLLRKFKKDYDKKMS